MQKKAFYENFDDYREQFNNKDFSSSELILARQYMGNKNTTKKQWEQIKKTVGLIFFYAPKEVSNLAYATLIEMTMREPYMEKFWGNE